MRPDAAAAALPMPLGEPGGLWSAAAALRAAAADRSPARRSAASGGQVGPLDAWTGDAASAAREELTVVAQRERAMADRLVRAAAVVSAYGDELDAAQRTVATLQGSWDGAVPTDPLAALPESALAGIAGLHAVVSADLQLAADVAAHRLRELIGEVVAVDAPGRRGTPAVGLGGPGLRRTPPSAQRRWPTSRSCRASSRAARPRSSPSRSWTTWWPSPRATVERAPSGRPPVSVLAAGIRSSLKPCGSVSTRTRRAGWSTPSPGSVARRASAVLALLGAALATAANPVVRARGRPRHPVAP